MTEGIEAITTKAISLALDAASLRQQAISANIANSNTPGYIPVFVDFESQMEDARMALQNQGCLDAASLQGVVPRLYQTATSFEAGISPKVMLDMEVAKLSQNAVHFQALVRGLSKHFEIMSSAVSDGKK